MEGALPMEIISKIGILLLAILPEYIIGKLLYLYHFKMNAVVSVKNQMKETFPLEVFQGLPLKACIYSASYCVSKICPVPFVANFTQIFNTHGKRSVL